MVLCKIPVMQGTQLQMCAGRISLFYEKPTGDDLDKVRSVSQNATEENPFEASMGIYVFKRDVLVSLDLVSVTCSTLTS